MARRPMSLFTDVAEKIDRRYGWDKLPWPLGLVTLIGLRNRLREKNLYDTGRGPLDKPDVSVHPRYLTARTLDRWDRVRRFYFNGVLVHRIVQAQEEHRAMLDAMLARDVARLQDLVRVHNQGALAAYLSYLSAGVGVG